MLPAVGLDTFSLLRNSTHTHLEEAFPPVLVRLFELECSSLVNFLTLPEFDETALNVFLGSVISLVNYIGSLCLDLAVKE